MQDTGNVKGVRLASGQDIFSHKLVLDPSLTLPLASSVSDHLEKSLQVLISRKNNGKVAKGICITRSSVKPDTSNIVVVYPPRCKINIHIDGWMKKQGFVISFVEE